MRDSKQTHEKSPESVPQEDQSYTLWKVPKETGYVLVDEYCYRLPPELLTEEEKASDDPLAGVVRVSEYDYVKRRPQPQLSPDELKLMKARSEYDLEIRTERRKQRERDGERYV